MEETFRALLLSDSGVSSHVGNRVNFGTHPQGRPLPAIVLNVVSSTEDNHMNGKGPFNGRMQVDVYGGTYKAATLAARAVLNKLNSYRGGGFDFIEHISTRNSRKSGSNEVSQPFRASLDFNIIWRI